MLKNYFKPTARKFLKLSLGLRAVIGFLSASAYIADHPGWSFWLLVSGAIVEFAIQCLAPSDYYYGNQDYNNNDDDCDRGRYSNNDFRNGGRSMLILLFGSALLTFLSCRTTKMDHEISTKDTSGTTSIKSMSDSGNTNVKQLGIQSSYKSQYKKESDSLISLASKYLYLNIMPDELGIATTATGKKVSHGKTIDTNGLRLSYNVDTNGNLSIDCKADSLNLVIKNLVYIHDSTDAMLYKQYDSLSSALKVYHDSVTEIKKSAVIEHKSKTVKKGSFLSQYWWVFAIIIVVAVFVVKKMFGR